MTGRTWEASVFDRLYAADPDPWRFETSPYERVKYAATLALLPPGRHFGAVLELGCSAGAFSRLLRPRCDRLLGVDCADAPLQRARDAADDAMRFERHVLPGSFPRGTFDLVVVGELLYFLDEKDLAHLARRVAAALAPPAPLVLLANWTGPTDTPLTGDAAAAAFARHLALGPARLRACTTVRGETYRLDLLSVA